MTTRILKQNNFGSNSGNYKTIKKEKGVIRCRPSFALIAVNEAAFKWDLISLVELVMKKKKVIYVNARNVEGDLSQYKKMNE